MNSSEQPHLLQVYHDFIEENKKLCQNMSEGKRGSRYSKSERETRRSEVYKFHFEYGYSARKIAELLDVNRNTVNGDINYWYSRISKNVSGIDPEKAIITVLQRMQSQRVSLRAQLDKTRS